MTNIIHEVDLGVDVVTRPREEHIAHRGPRRLVKLVPIPGSAAPAIWTSPDAHTQDIDGVRTLCRTVVVLVSKSPPTCTRVYVPKDFYETLPEVPVEW